MRIVKKVRLDFENHRCNLSKKVLPLEFRTQQWLVQISMMQIVSNKVRLEFEAKQIRKKFALSLEPNHFLQKKTTEFCDN